MRRSRRGLSAALVLLMLPGLGAAPADPVTVEGVRYEPIDEDIPPKGVAPGLRRASIRAVDVASGRELWTVRVDEMYEPIDPADRADAGLGRIDELRSLGGDGLLVAVGGRPALVLDPETRATSRPPDGRGRPRICAVHGEMLREGLVPIAYGLFRRSKAELDAMRDLFPEARTSVEGGCIIVKGGPTTELVRYCQPCRDVKAVWRPAD